MTEDSVPHSAQQSEPAQEPEPLRRKYVATLYGQSIIVEARDHPQVRAHMARKARVDVTVRLADFDDGIAAARRGLPIEIAGPTDDLFSAPGA